MKIFTYDRDYSSINFQLISENPDEILYFDLETTGLSAKSSDLYMIGYGHMTKDAFVITLLLNDDGCSEPAMLEYFVNVLATHHTLVSYNGNTFDIPYIKEKFRQFDIDYDISQMDSFDIFKIMRKYKKQLHLSSMKQSDLEQLIHFKRDAFLSGGDLIPVYKRYLSDNRTADLNELIRHNLDDIDGLINITDMLAVHKLYDGIFEVSGLSIEAHMLTIQLYVPNKLPFRLTYGYNGIHINGIDNIIHIKLPVIHDCMKFFFPDYKDYYYLPVEDISIHKSMAAYVDTDHKVKATKETAFVKKEGDFIYCPRNIGLPLFSKSAKDNIQYILLNKDFLENTEIIVQYICTLFTTG